MLKELVATALLSGSIGLKSSVPITVPYHDLSRSAVDYDRSSSMVQGVYNFRDYFDFTEFEDYATSHGYDDYFYSEHLIDLIPTGGMPIYRFTSPLSYSGRTFYISQFEFSYYPGDYVGIGIVCYNGSQGANIRVDFNVDQNVYLSSVSSQFSYLYELLFELHEDVGLSREESMIFDFFFTHDNNSFITSYNGYYTWGNATRYIQPVTCFGSSLFGSSLYYDLITPDQNGSTSWDTVYYLSVDYISNDYTVYVLDGTALPLQNYNKSWLVNWKMSYDTKTKLELYGVFQYVPDHTYDDVTFKDFFFSIVDTPVYFVSSILSFELFGVNLFIALSGLLTLCVILVLIKKFW